MFHSVSLFIVLCLFWLLLSGFFTAFLLSAGLGCALAVVWVALALASAEMGPTLFDRAQAANTVSTVVMLLLAATVYFRLDSAFASRIPPYAVIKLHVAEVGGKWVTQSA